MTDIRLIYFWYMTYIWLMIFMIGDELFFSSLKSSSSGAIPWKCIFPAPWRRAPVTQVTPLAAAMLTRPKLSSASSGNSEEDKLTNYSRGNYLNKIAIGDFGHQGWSWLGSNIANAPTPIPQNCYGRHGRCPCNFFLPGVIFSRLNAKKLTILQYNLTHCVQCNTMYNHWQWFTVSTHHLVCSFTLNV